MSKIKAEDIKMQFLHTSTEEGLIDLEKNFKYVKSFLPPAIAVELKCEIDYEGEVYPYEFVLYLPHKLLEDDRRSLITEGTLYKELGERKEALVSYLNDKGVLNCIDRAKEIREETSVKPPKKVKVEKAEVEEVEEGFKKTDIGKLMYSLIPPEVLRGFVEVLMYGMKKYGEDNWKKCEDKSRYINALYRHLESHRSGEVKDEESNLTHLQHALANVAFLYWFQVKGK